MIYVEKIEFEIFLWKVKVEIIDLVKERKNKKRRCKFENIMCYLLVENKSIFMLYDCKVVI